MLLKNDKMKRLQAFIMIIGIYFFFSSSGFSQSDTNYEVDSIRMGNFMEKHFSLVTGYHIHRNQFLELGVGVKNNGVVGTHPVTSIFGISNEFKINDIRNDFIWGFKGGIWLGGGVAGMNLGINLINYTDFIDNTLRFRPEIGFGFDHFRMVYGYNLPIINRDFTGINKHNFSLNIIFDLKELD